MSPPFILTGTNFDPRVSPVRRPRAPEILYFLARDSTVNDPVLNQVSLGNAVALTPASGSPMQQSKSIAAVGPNLIVYSATAAGSTTVPANYPARLSSDFGATWRNITAAASSSVLELHNLIKSGSALTALGGQSRFTGEYSLDAGENWDPIVKTNEDLAVFEICGQNCAVRARGEIWAWAQNTVSPFLARLWRGGPATFTRDTTGSTSHVINNGISYHPGADLFVCPQGGQIRTSVDGLTWTDRQAIPSTNFGGGVYDPYDGKMKVICTGTVWESSDCINWTQINNTILNTLSLLFPAREALYAFRTATGANFTESTAYRYSVDRGTTWQNGVFTESKIWEDAFQG